MQVDPAQRDTYVEAFRDLVSRAREFEGCVELAITADSLDPGRVDNLEIWASAAALDAWREVSNPPQVEIEFKDQQMKRYDAEDGGPLF